MYVLATAGHVDHGKSTLVRALTGMEPDRWAEEQRRQMTIDLGFAWFALPNGQHVSLIDVPGHERFIKNMLAGMGGIDAALLVIAADEGVMPQTREHLAVLDLLGISHGIVVLTKCDLVDAEWLDLVHEDIRHTLAPTTLANAPCVTFSAPTHDGLDTLITTIGHMLDRIPTRTTANGIPRLPIDRSFSLRGFGTVVTGTLLDGPLPATGQEIEILPSGRRARVRGVQTHQQQQSIALPGTRVAVNLSGIHHRQIVRGDVLTLPGHIRPSQMLDVWLRLIPTIPFPLEHNTPLDLFVGSAEVRCRVALLDAERLEASEMGWVQLRLAQPVAVLPRDVCILRQPSPSCTIGGGTIVDTHPPRHRRFRADVLAGLATRLAGTPDMQLFQEIDRAVPSEWASIPSRLGLTDADAMATIQHLVHDGRAYALGGGAYVISADGWNQLVHHMTDHLRHYHRRYPIRIGMPRQDLRQRLALDNRTFAAVLQEATSQQIIALNETRVWLADHSPTLTPDQKYALEALLSEMHQHPYAPPPPTLDAEVLMWAIERQLLIHLSQDAYLLPEPYAHMVQWVDMTLDTHGSVTVSQLRDHFGSSRKYALALLEHLDELKQTRRNGDVRVRY